MAQLSCLEIHRGEDGSHRAVHQFKSAAIKRGGRMSGGMSMEQPKAEEHHFGPSEPERERLMTHIATTLGLGQKGAGAPEPGDGASGGY